MKRKTASWGMVCERPQAKLAIEYIRIEPISARVRPILSARNPKPRPPIAEANRVRELRRPAWGLLMPRWTTRSARTIEYSITSMASSIQPRPPAMSERRSAVVISSGHSSPKIRLVAVLAVMRSAHCTPSPEPSGIRRLDQEKGACAGRPLAPFDGGRIRERGIDVAGLRDRRLAARFIAQGVDTLRRVPRFRGVTAGEDQNFRLLPQGSQQVELTAPPGLQGLDARFHSTQERELLVKEFPHLTPGFTFTRLGRTHGLDPGGEALRFDGIMTGGEGFDLGIDGGELGLHPCRCLPGAPAAVRAAPVRLDAAFEIAAARSRAELGVARAGTAFEGRRWAATSGLAQNDWREVGVLIIRLET